MLANFNVTRSLKSETISCLGPNETSKFRISTDSKRLQTRCIETVRVNSKNRVNKSQIVEWFARDNQKIKSVYDNSMQPDNF